jgi:hypothetical protein
MFERRSLRRVIGISFNWLAAIAAAGCFGQATLAIAGERSAQEREAAALVEEALHREIYGQSDERDELLAKAAQASPDYGLAHWHRGEVKIDGKWVDSTSASASLESDRRLENYRYFRGQQPDTVLGQWTTAEWCRKRGLAEQERAHLMRVLILEPEHAAARERLGFRRLGGEWVLESEVESMAERSRAADAALAKWRPVIEEIRDGLRRRGSAKREAARERALAISDPAARSNKRAKPN